MILSVNLSVSPLETIKTFQSEWEEKKTEKLSMTFDSSKRPWGHIHTTLLTKQLFPHRHKMLHQGVWTQAYLLHDYWRITESFW